MKSYDLKIGGRTFSCGTHLMAILNVTPDSFFKDSRVRAEDVVGRAARLIAEGAEVLDVGGQSTRPQAVRISAEEELKRVLPAVRALKKAFPNVPLSVDTFYASVAEECAKCGADAINDVGGLRDEDMAKVVARFGTAIVVMRDSRLATGDILEDKRSGLSEAVRTLLDEGVGADRIMLDAGIGFNRTKEEDVAVLKAYPQFIEEFDFPFLLGASRKSFLGGEAEDRLEKTLLTTAFAKRAGALFVRVHDVKENAELL